MLIVFLLPFFRSPTIFSTSYCSSYDYSFYSLMIIFITLWKMLKSKVYNSGDYIKIYIRNSFIKKKNIPSSKFMLYHHNFALKFKFWMGILLIEVFSFKIEVLININSKQKDWMIPNNRPAQFKHVYYLQRP